MSAPKFFDENGNPFEFSHEAYGKAVLEIVKKNVEGTDHIIECSAGSSKGDNYVGIVFRVDVKDEKHKSLKLSFILKSAPQSEARREEFYAHQIFERESIFYDEILPLYQKFQKEKGINIEKDGFHETPMCLKILHEAPNEGIFLDNLRPKGFDMFNRHDDLTKDFVMLTMKALGKMHAIFYSLKDQVPELIKKYQDMDDLFELFCNEDDSPFKIMIESNNKMAINFVKRCNNEDLKKRVLEVLSKDPIKQLQKVVRGDLAEPYAVLCHGDCWNNNMMFRKDKHVSPVEVKLLDFQVLRYASPACDLSYYLFGCTTKELRDKHYVEFLDAYYEALSTLMMRLGSSPERIFPRKALDDQLKQFGYFGVLMGQLIIPFFVSDPEDAPDFDLIATKYKESREDPSKEFDTTLVEFKSENKRAKYEERLMGVFEDMCKYGYI